MFVASEKVFWVLKGKGRKKDIFGYEFEIYVANKRKLKAFCEKEKKSLRAKFWSSSS